MSMEWFNYIESVEKEINTVKTQFFLKWNQLLKQHLELDGDFRIEDHADVFGGFWIDEKTYEKMDSNLKCFYDRRVKKSSRIFLRGYDYYQADPLMNIKKNAENKEILWKTFRDKWISYPRKITFDFLNKKNISLENWLGTLALLEYLFSDLTSFRWFLFRNTDLLSDCDVTIKIIEEFTEIIGKAIACTLHFNLNSVYCLLTENYNKIISSEQIRTLICLDYEIKDSSSVRTVREGDSITIIYAAYLMKLKVFCESNDLTHISLISNAFGAMNIGIILKYLLAPETIASHSNIFYAQNRAVEDVVFGNNSSPKCCFLSQREVDTQSQAIIIVDDSIFSGKSYYNIKKFLSHENVYLLPLTLNCDCIKYCRIGIDEDDDMDFIAHRAVEWSMEVGNILPTFCSFWDFARIAPENNIQTNNMEFNSVLHGDDMLIKHLWAIYRDEILR